MEGTMMRLTTILGALLAAAAAIPTAGADDQTIDTSLFANARLKTLMDNVESKADRFEDKLETALANSKFRGTPIGESLNTWAEDLEDEVDDMAEDFAERNSAELSEHFENSMLMAAAVNRAMLRHELSSSAETEWRSLRSELNSIATLLERPALPNLTVVTFWTLPPQILTRNDVRQVMDELEASTDRFKDKFEKAWFTSISGQHQRRLFKQWSDALEDSSDQMLDKFKAKSATDTREKLEQTLLLAEGVNRMILSSATSSTPVAEWNLVRQQLNTLARAFGYPILSDQVSRVTPARAAH
jgi:hypothetical protein